MTDKITYLREVKGNETIGGNLVGEAKCQELLPNMDLVKEVEVLMTKYKVDYMWFGWSKFGIFL